MEKFKVGDEVQTKIERGRGDFRYTNEQLTKRGKIKKIYKNFILVETEYGYNETFKPYELIKS